MSIEPLLKSKINSVIGLYSKGQIQEALDAVETLTKSYPNEALLFNISGACFAGLRQLGNAVKSYEKALTIKPDYAEVHYNLGVTLQELGQLDDFRLKVMSKHSLLSQTTLLHVIISALHSKNSVN